MKRKMSLEIECCWKCSYLIHEDFHDYSFHVCEKLGLFSEDDNGFNDELIKQQMTDWFENKCPLEKIRDE